MNLEKEIFDISLNDIIPNRFQPREIFKEEELKELSTSIKEHGVIQPIIVRKIGDKYEIIAGERRFRASQLAGKTTIPALVRNIDDKEAAKIALLENLQRSNLTPIEEAKTYQTILKIDNITQEELAANLGKSQSTIANKMRLLTLNEEVQTALLNSQISERHARSLLSLDQDQQVQMLHRIINEKLTVRQLDEEVMKITGKMPVDQTEVAQDTSMDGGALPVDTFITNNSGINLNQTNNTITGVPQEVTVPGVNNQNEQAQQTQEIKPVVEQPVQEPVAPVETPVEQVMTPEVQAPVVDTPIEQPVQEPVAPVEPSVEPAITPEVQAPVVDAPIEQPVQEPVAPVETPAEQVMTPEVQAPVVDASINQPVQEPVAPVEPPVEPAITPELQTSGNQPMGNIFDKLRVEPEETTEKEPIELATPNVSSVINIPEQVETNSNEFENIYDLRFAINNFRQAIQNTEKFGFKVTANEYDKDDKYQIVIEIDKK